MPLLHFYDRATIPGSLRLPLDAELHRLLVVRVDHLTAAGLLNMSEIIVISAETTEPELVAAIGFTPLIDLDGNRFGQTTSCPGLDYVARVSPSYDEAIIAVGNSGFAYHLLVHDDADADLVELCREQAA